MFNSSLYPYASMTAKTGLLSALKNIKWGTILSNTQKTLGVINQAIPIVYQIKPIWNNAKTVFKIVGAIKDGDSTTTSVNNNYKQVNSINTNNIIDNNNYVETKPTSSYINRNQPNFFL